MGKLSSQLGLVAIRTYVTGDIASFLSERVEECAQEIIKLMKTKITWSVYESLRAERPDEKGRCKIELASNTRW